MDLPTFMSMGLGFKKEISNEEYPNHPPDTVFFAEKNKPNNVGGACRNGTTNIGAEIMAAIFAIEQASRSNCRKLRVFSDCQVLCDADKLIPQWKANGWYKLFSQYGERKPVENRREFEKLDQVLDTNRQSGMVIRFVHVDSHSGNQDHNAADHLARAGALRY